ncbi:MAG: sulfotransferase family 2 domain-containing protein [Gammaproteobacteria bacterium]
MVISHRHQFIFIKTNKTAGTSFELALARICGPDDIITPVSHEDEKVRRALRLPGPQNHRLPLREVGTGKALSALLRGRASRELCYYNHISAAEIRSRLGEDRWRSYFKFCFERNPWDRVISLYFWKQRRQPRLTLAEFIRSEKVQVLKRRGIGLYAIDGQVVVDRVCRFENLAGELDALRRQWGIAEALELPRLKVQYRRDKRPYHELLSDDDRQYIAELFRDEIALMGYRYDR